MKSTWGEDCLEFRPERWMSSDGNKFVMHDSYRFVAFNAGPRICLGKDLAYLQMKSVAASVLLRHKLAVVPGHKVEQKMSLTLFMKYGLKVNVNHRDLQGIVASLKIERNTEGELLLHGKESVISAVKCNGESYDRVDESSSEMVVGVA